MDAAASNEPRPSTLGATLPGKPGVGTPLPGIDALCQMELAPVVITRTVLLLRTRAEAQIKWYATNAKPKSILSSVVRFLVIALGVAGGLCPIVPASVAWSADARNFGYVLLAAAAGLLLLDKGFGLSSSWMRFKLTQMHLEKELHTFVYQMEVLIATVENQSSVPPSLASRFLQLADAFVEATERAVVTETEGWIAEFQASILQIESYVEKSRSHPPEKPSK